MPHRPLTRPLEFSGRVGAGRALGPAGKQGSRPALHQRREVIDALANWLAGCAWRLLPHDLPPWQTVCHYWRIWRLEGRWEQILAVLREWERVRLGRESAPSAMVLDSQSVKTTEKGLCREFCDASRIVIYLAWPRLVISRAGPLS